MAKYVTAKVDTSEITALFERMNDPALKESLGRRMGAAGGAVFRDEAKNRAPVSDHGVDYPESSRGSKSPGTLRDAIYLAYDKKYSNDSQQIYSISWNNKQAWYGKLVEFGYFQRYYVGRNTSGKYYTDKSRKLSIPLWVPAKPFLYPSFAAKQQQATKTMIEVGRVEFPKLMSEGK